MLDDPNPIATGTAADTTTIHIVSGERGVLVESFVSPEGLSTRLTELGKNIGSLIEQVSVGLGAIGAKAVYTITTGDEKPDPLVEQMMPENPSILAVTLMPEGRLIRNARANITTDGYIEGVQAAPIIVVGVNKMSDSLTRPSAIALATKGAYDLMLSEPAFVSCVGKSPTEVAEAIIKKAWSIMAARRVVRAAPMMWPSR
jgi:hypothetical protein